MNDQKRRGFLTPEEWRAIYGSRAAEVFERAAADIEKRAEDARLGLAIELLERALKSGRDHESLFSGAPWADVLEASNLLRALRQRRCTGCRASGEEIRQQVDGSLACRACGRVVVASEQAAGEEGA